MRRFQRRGTGLLIALAMLWLAACAPLAAPSATPPDNTLAPSDTPTPEVGAVLPTRVPPTAGPSPTPLPTITLTPSDTPTSSDTPTATNTPTDTATPTVTDTPTSTATSIPPTDIPTSTTTPVPPTETPTAEVGGLRVVLTWATTGNVDLGVQDAAGNLISVLRPTSASGGALSGDANALCASAVANPVEEVAWPSGQTPPVGRYHVIARYQAACGNSGPVQVNIVVSLGGVEVLRQSAALELGREFAFDFTYSASGGVTLAGLPTELAYGDTTTGAISDAQYEWLYTFTGEQGDAVTITLQATGGGLDPYLILRDAAGNQVAVNDDAPGSGALDAAIQNIVLPADGTYTIVATRFQGQAGASGGDFELTLRREAPVTVTPMPSVTAVAGPTRPPLAIAYGVTVTGAISDAQFEVRYTFDGGRGDPVTITLRRTGGDLDPYLILLDAAGNEVATNDDAEDGTGTLDSRINNLPLPAAGTYTIIATRFQRQAGSSVGEFELTLERGSRAAATSVAPPPGGPRLAYGVTATGTISDAQPAVRFTFDGVRDDLVTIRMHRRSGNLDSLLILLNPAGEQMAFNDDAPDAGETRDARINRFRLPASGTYTIVATRFEGQAGSTSGDFEVVLERVN